MKPLGIYLHVPFCVQKCRYCDFLSAPACGEVRRAYLDALKREIASRTEELKSYSIHSLYIGGGTPSILSPEEFGEIARTLRAHTGIWQEDAERTIEANPGTVTEEKAQAWRAWGMNRVSMGMQAAQNRLLQILGRIHTQADVETSMKILRQEGFSNLNLDLMMGLPGQSLQDWRESLEQAVCLEPEHISCYSLILEEGTPLYEDVRKGRISLPEEETDREMYDLTLRYLAEKGYRQYEISNFAKPGYASRHNLSYWDLSEYQGIGLGAASYRKGRRLKNEEDLTVYIHAQDPAALERIEEEASEKDAMEEWMFLGFRRTSGVRASEFEARFHKKMWDVYGTVLKKLEAEGLIVCRDDGAALSRRGLDLANIVFEEFLLD